MPRDKHTPPDADQEDLLDEALSETFPASDPVALISTTIPTRPAHDKGVGTPAMTKTFKLYGASGGGSMIVEAAFGFTDLPIEFVELSWDDIGWNSEALKDINPLGQVPTLILPDGRVMTESGAIFLHLADIVPDYPLVPPPGDPTRADFLRWLFFLVAAIYPTFTFGDVTDRWVGAGHKEGAGKALRHSTDEHRKKLWRFVEKQVEGPWFLGDKMSALDLYMWVMSYWRPGKDWMAAETPKLAAIAAAVHKLPVAKKVLARNKL